MSTRLGRPLRRSGYARNAATLARELLGRVLVRVLDDGMRLSGIIVETEAYLGVKDRASHAFGGRRTARNAAMYGKPGTAYVYFTYGMHYCMNVVCGEVDDPPAVLIRALEPLEGIERMRELRTGHWLTAAAAPSKPMKDTALCSGPARLCEALAIDRDLNGIDLARDKRLFVCEPPANRPPLRPRDIVRAARIGVAYSGDWAAKPLRFLVRANPHVSVPPSPPERVRSEPLRGRDRPAKFKRPPRSGSGGSGVPGAFQRPKQG